MLNNHQIRIKTIQDAPFSYRERDLLTGAEKYLTDAIDLSIIKMTIKCFPEVAEATQEKINRVWRYSTAAFHLRKKVNTTNGEIETKHLKIEAAKIYELEGQRVLGSVFSLENNFWNAFYKRQEVEADKVLAAIDALHFASMCQHTIAYQLLIQAFREILQGYYSKTKNRNSHFKNAKRLLVDLPTSGLQTWLNHQLV